MTPVALGESTTSRHEDPRGPERILLSEAVIPFRFPPAACSDWSRPPEVDRGRRVASIDAGSDPGHVRFATRRTCRQVLWRRSLRGSGPSRLPCCTMRASPPRCACAEANCYHTAIPLSSGCFWCPDTLLRRFLLRRHGAGLKGTAPGSPRSPTRSWCALRSLPRGFSPAEPGRHRANSTQRPVGTGVVRHAKAPEHDAPRCPSTSTSRPASRPRVPRRGRASGLAPAPLPRWSPAPSGPPPRVPRGATAREAEVEFCFRRDPLAQRAGSGCMSPGSPSKRSWMTSTIAALPDARARAMAASSWSSRSTRSPWPPSDDARAAKSGLS